MHLKCFLKGIIMLSPQVRALVKATVPVLQQHGVTLTSHFYQRMFSHNPELKNIFNQAHQASGHQQQALAGAVLGYAQNIDDPSVLAPVLSRITHKHVSLGIRAEHYPIVGHHLLASIREVLGDAASDELIDAWAAAYGQLADLLIAEENRLYADSTTSKGGWSGLRPFKVREIVEESAEIASFYLVPADGGAVPQHQPGQFVSAKVYLPEQGLNQPRQYSLSCAPNERYLRISVKREDARDTKPAGMVSNRLHAKLAVGDVLELTAPAGDFVLHQERSGPVVLISGGVGQTPLLAMLEQLTTSGSQRRIVYVHGCRSGAVHAFRDTLNRLVAEHKNLSKAVFYEEVNGHDRQGQDYDHIGRIELARIADQAVLPDADYYLCGPLPFMSAQLQALKALGVPAERVHYEVFGSHPLNV
jgi:nitric oxide dioxygenase